MERLLNRENDCLNRKQSVRENRQASDSAKRNLLIKESMQRAGAGVLKESRVSGGKTKSQIVRCHKTMAGVALSQTQTQALETSLVPRQAPLGRVFIISVGPFE